MDNFDKIIKQKVEQFDVPYNDAHWAEINGKLNSLRLAKIKTIIASTVAVISIIAISSYLIFSTNSKKITNKNIITDNTSLQKNETQEVNVEKGIAIVNDKKTREKTISNQPSIKNQQVKKEITNDSNPTKKEVLTQESSPIKTFNEPEKSNSPIINAEFIVYNNKGCLGQKSSFEPIKGNSPVSYTWNFGDGTTSHKVNPKHTYKSIGKFTVTLTLRNRQTGVETTSIQEDVINILPSPQANFSYTETSITHDNNKLKYPYTTFKAKNLNEQNSYTWNFGNEKTSNSMNGKTIFKKKDTKYTTTLIVENTYGCVNSSTLEVLNQNGIDLYAPTGIHPNSNHDTKAKFFMPGKLLGWDVSFEMVIMNKSGNLIYKTSDKNAPWNGKKNNIGQVMPEGAYLWKVVTYDAEGTSLQQHGQINLVQ